MSISTPFIERPIATSLLAAAVLLAGFAAFPQLPVAPLPQTDIPTIMVSASLPGASPETMASAVATPLERRLGRIAGVTEMTSSSNLGTVGITLQFDLSRDVDSAARDVQAAIAAAASELPANLPFRPTYRKFNPADAPILIVALTSETVPRPQVFDAAVSVIAQRIAQVPGVGQVTVGEGQQPAVRVQVDPEALAGVGLGLEDVRTALANATVDQPKGSLSGPEKMGTVAANDQLFSAAGFRQLILAWRNGAPVRLSDVAKLDDGIENNRAASWADGVPAAMLIVRRQPGANILDTNAQVKAILPSLMASVRPGINYKVTLDRTQTIRASLNDVEMALMVSVLLVSLVVFLFLRSGRATTIPTVAVVVSLIGTFAVMWLLNFSVDNLSLMALTVSTGFVVDDAVVMTENIIRLIEQGEPPLRAALKGAKQIGFTIVSITASLLAVFIPVLMMGGLVGRLLREFAVTLSVAIALSALVSLTLTPTMCAVLLVSKETPGRFHRITERGFNGLLAIYDRGLRWVLNHPRGVLLFTLGAVALNVVLFSVIPKGLFPNQDNGVIMGVTQAPQDVSFHSMEARQRAVNAVLSRDPDVLFANASIGNDRGSNVGTAFLQLRDKPPRTATAEEVIGRLRKELAKIPGISVFLQPGQDLRIGGYRARTQYQYTLQANDLDELTTWAPRLLESLKKLPGLRDVATDQQTDGLELRVDIDRDTASRLGVSVKEIDDTLYDAYGQRQVATTYTQLNQYRVVLEVKPEFLDSPDALDRLFVRSRTGAMVPLSAVAHRSVGRVPLSISHQGQFPSVTLSFNLAPGYSLGQAVDEVRQVEQRIGLPATVRASFTGSAQAFQQSLANQPFLILFALLTVYIVLGVLYESYVHPITILSTLPTAGVGALLALMVFKQDLTVIALVGLVLLIGIVKKNAIMMVDFAIEAERDHSLSPREAIYQASLLRFRPIMMTTAAALLGALPLALGSGIGSEFRRPLGISIVGGLLFSQAFTLFTTPVIYLVMDGFTRRKRRPTTVPSTV